MFAGARALGDMGICEARNRGAMEPRELGTSYYYYITYFMLQTGSSSMNHDSYTPPRGSAQRKYRGWCAQPELGAMTLARRRDDPHQKATQLEGRLHRLVAFDALQHALVSLACPAALPLLQSHASKLLCVVNAQEARADCVGLPLPVEALTSGTHS